MNGFRASPGADEAHARALETLSRTTSRAAAEQIFLSFRLAKYGGSQVAASMSELPVPRARGEHGQSHTYPGLTITFLQEDLPPYARSHII
jgi:hypothetical protein